MNMIVIGGTEYVRDPITGKLYVVLGEHGRSTVSIRVDLATTDTVGAYMQYTVRLSDVGGGVTAWTEEVDRLPCAWSAQCCAAGQAYCEVDFAVLYPYIMLAAHSEAGGEVDHYRADALYHGLHCVVGLPDKDVSQLLDDGTGMSLKYLLGHPSIEFNEGPTQKAARAMLHLRREEKTIIREMTETVLAGITDVVSLQSRRTLWGYDHQRGAFQYLRAVT